MNDQKTYGYGQITWENPELIPQKSSIVVEVGQWGLRLISGAPPAAEMTAYHGTAVYLWGER